MIHELTDIEVEILQKLSSYRYCKLKVNSYEIDSSLFDLAGEVERDQELGYYLDSLHNRGYIYMNSYAVERDKSVNYKGSNIVKIRWRDINIRPKGTAYINSYNFEKEQEKKSEIVAMIYSEAKSKYAEAIKILFDHETYVEISINADGNVVTGILIDKGLLPLVQEYSWSINKDKMIITKNHYPNSKKRNISINQLLFEEELNNLNSICNKEHIVYYKNGNNLDKRRENLIFMTRTEQYAAKNLDKITGIYLSSNNTEDRTSYEVRINKKKERIYLIKTTNYREAFYGAFLLRFLFWGRKYTKPFIDKLHINEKTLNNLEVALEKYKADLNDIEFTQELIKFNLSNKFIARALKTMDRRKHLIVQTYRIDLRHSP